MMKPKLVSQTKYFLSLIPKDSNDAHPSTINILVGKALSEYRFELVDTSSTSFDNYIKFSDFSSDDYEIVFFPTIKDAYHFITLNESKFLYAVKQSSLDIDAIDAFEWHIMNTKTEVHSLASESENNIDEVIASIALEELKENITPAQLEILRNKI